MSVIRSTLELYGRAAKTAGRALVGSPAALVGLVVAQLAFFAVAVLVSRAGLGLLGGFIIALVAAACVGAYLALVRGALTARKGIGFGAIQDSLGAHFGDVINIMFLFFIFDLLTMPVFSALPVLAVLAWLLISVLFNPVPELIWTGRGSGGMGFFGGLEVLKEALAWVKKHGLEWFAPQIVVGIAVAFVGHDSLLAFLQSFGPRFGFVESFSNVVPLVEAVATGFDAEVLLRAVLTPLLTHFMMLFRGALFQELDGSSRRSREWQARFR